MPAPASIWYNLQFVFQKLHSRLGDFWWYSLMLFVACRSGDVIQAFIGLWLVPKYVGASELGAVMPLQSLAGLFAAPLAVLATVFAKYVNVYATRGEYGKVKCFIRDVIGASCLVFLVCIAAALVVLPHFYERLRVTAGLLTVLILASGFVGNLAQLFTSALQGLKLFKTITIQNLIGAPIRLVTLLVAMPVRALSGYILGQSTPPAVCSLLAAGSLRRHLRGVACDASWRKDLGEIGRYLLPVAAYTCLSTLFGTICITVYRQRLPEAESAAYYLLTRFTDVVNYVGCAMLFVLFPLASEAHEGGRESYSALRKTIVAAVFVTAAASVALAVFGRPLLSLLPTWRPYVGYAHLFPALVVITGASVIIGAGISYEMSCRRFGAAFAILIFNVGWTMLLVGLSGFEFFRGVLPDATIDCVASWRVNRLSVYTWASLVSALLQLALLRFVIGRAQLGHQR